MTKSGMNLQDSFLNQVRKENTEIMLMLLDGSRLVGYVRGFDNFTVIMNVRGSQHLIYKHAIAQLVSRRAPHAEGDREQREGAHTSGTPTQEEGTPAADQTQSQPQGQGQGRPENIRREGAPRRERPEHRGDHGERGERNDEGQAGKSKFNTLDFSSIKFEQEKQG